MRRTACTADVGMPATAAVRSVVMVMAAVMVPVPVAMILAGAPLPRGRVNAAVVASRREATACSAVPLGNRVGRPGTISTICAIKLGAMPGQHARRVRRSGRHSSSGGHCSGIPCPIGIGLEPIVEERICGCLCVFSCSSLKELAGFGVSVIRWWEATNRRVLRAFGWTQELPV